jgi:hypothetical protein
MPNDALIQGLSTLLQQSLPGDAQHVPNNTRELLDQNEAFALALKLKDNSRYKEQSFYKESAFFSNEYGFSTTLEEIKALPIKRTPGKRSVAMLVGESHFLAALPDLAQHAETIIFADMDANVLAQNMYQLACFRRSKNYGEFLLFLSADKNPCHDFNGFTGLAFCEAFIRSNVRLDPMTSIACPEHFESCKKALEKLDFFAFTLDLFDHDAVDKLNQVIEESRSWVSILNVSNVHHYDVREKAVTVVNYPANISDRKDYRHVRRRGYLDTTISKLGADATAILFSVADEWQKPSDPSAAGTRRTSDLMLTPTLQSTFTTSVSAYICRINDEQERINCCIRLYGDIMPWSSRLPIPGNVQPATDPQMLTFFRKTKTEIESLFTHQSVPEDRGQSDGCTLPPGSYSDKEGRTVVGRFGK